MTTAYFSNIRKEIITQLEKAHKSIKVAVCWFTSQELFDILLAKLDQEGKSKVSVELIITNDATNNRPKSGKPLQFKTFISKGGKLYFGNGERFMHNKYCIIDDEVLINGSYNWSVKAETSYENIVVHRADKELLIHFRWNFSRIKAASIKLDSSRMYDEKAIFNNKLIEEYIEGQGSSDALKKQLSSPASENSINEAGNEELDKSSKSSNEIYKQYFSRYYIGVIKRDKRFEPIISAGHILPVEKPHKFYVIWNGLDRVEFQVVYSPNSNGYPFEWIGNFTTGKVPNLKQNTVIYIIFKIYSSDTLIVSVHIPDIGYHSEEVKMPFNSLHILSTS